MDSWIDWLWQSCVPVAKRVLGALGFGYVSFEGAATALETAFDAVRTALGGLAGDVAQLLAMSGFFDAMSITSGGIMSGLAWMMLKRWAVSAGTVATA
jgi:hypothetical protein